MKNEFETIWNFVLATTPTGHAISVGQIVSVFFLLLVGYFGGRFVGFVLGRKLQSAKIRPDVIHILKRIIFF